MQQLIPPSSRITAIRAALDLLPADKRVLPGPLAELDALQAALRELPEPITDFEIADRLAGADPGELADVLDELDTQKRRSAVIKAATAGGLRNRLQQHQSQAVFEAVPELLEQLRPLFDSTVKELTKAAAKLPAGTAALDPAAILDAEAHSPDRQARNALITLEAIATAIPVALRNDGSTTNGTKAVAILDVPAAGPLLWDGTHEGHLNPPEDLQRCKAIAALVKDYDSDTRLTLLDVARGKYSGVTFSLPTSNQQVAARVERVSTAHMLKRADNLTPAQRERVDQRVWGR
jgi:hypothetical protein